MERRGLVFSLHRARAARPGLIYRAAPLLLCLALASGCILPAGAPPASGWLPLPGGPAANAPTRTPFQPQTVPGAAPTGLAQAPAAPPAGLNPAETPAAPAVPTALPTATAAPQSLLWIDPHLPPALRQAIQLPAGWAAAPQSNVAQAGLAPGGEAPLAHWVYALVAPFPTIPQGVSVEELRSAWQGQAAGPFAGRPLLMEPATMTAFAAFWGPPAPGAVETLPAGDLLPYAWDHRPAWAIVPFEEVQPGWKVLAVGGQSPLQKNFNPAAYPLNLPVYLGGSPAVVQELLRLAGPGTARPLLPATNWDPSRLTVVALTGVTALVRATAFTMEQQGVLYPGKDVRDWLREADITHISNEVPFAADCPRPNPVQEGMRFCSDDRYIQLLEDVGADVIELTGDHFQDWGTQAMVHTLDLYRERGWGVYGGGANLEAGRQALTLEHNGNKIAFIGCNAKGGAYAQADADHPGAARCDLDWMAAEISRLRDEGYLVIATFQHFEYYTYRAQPNQAADSRRLAEAGAVVVSGSQAHQPQAFELAGGGLIHYGLGNLFFDQYDVSLPCRQAFIDRHIFYAGRYLGVELLPILFVDYARPRPMTEPERQELLQDVFQASGW